MLVQSIEQEYAKRESDRTRDQEDKQKIIEEINKDRSTLGDISLEEWETTHKQKYQILLDRVKQNIPSLWLPLEFALSIKCILNISDITLPFAGIVLGGAEHSENSRPHYAQQMAPDILHRPFYPAVSGISFNCNT
jgi:hypothetical protein